MPDASTEIGSYFIEGVYNPFIISENKKVWIMFFVIIILIFIGLIISGLVIHNSITGKKILLNNFINYYTKKRKREVK